MLNNLQNGKILAVSAKTSINMLSDENKIIGNRYTQTDEGILAK